MSYQLRAGRVRAVVDAGLVASTAGPTPGAVLSGSDSGLVLPGLGG